jgi:hypothetical protein
MEKQQGRGRCRRDGDDEHRRLVTEKREEPNDQRVERQVSQEIGGPMDVSEQRIVGADVVEGARDRQIVRAIPEAVDRAHVAQERQIHEERPAHGREDDQDFRPHAGFRHGEISIF